tara:strand:- start:723 stop:974 length:252 start_codon:yes stop_codon:yes gene_type:complete
MCKLPFKIKIEITMKIRVEKLQKELSRGTAKEQYETLKQLKEFVLQSLAQEQSAFQGSVSGLQDLINEINGNIYGNVPSGDGN